MKPVVSSIVALAIALAPLTAMATPETSATKPVSTKVVKHHRHEKAATDKTAKVDDASESHGSKSSTKSLLKPVLHHATNVDVSGPAHHEPKIEKGVTVVPASLSTKHTVVAKTEEKDDKLEAPRTSHEDAKKPAKACDTPSNASGTKAVKSGHEKASRKPASKKADAASDKDGTLERDGGLEDLVARIRGKHESKSDVDTAVEPNEKSKSTKSESKLHRVSAKGATCEKDPIEVIRGPEIDTFALTTCDGSVAPLAVERLSVLIRPGSAARPVAPLAELAKKAGAELAQGVHRADTRLTQRIQELADHFGKPGSPIKLSIVSGMRPTSVGSMHAMGRAIDFRIEGTKNEDVIAFCKTLNDTACGFYPKSSFVHLDVRDPGTGHVSWIDASGPGEAPQFVTSWPPASKHAETKATVEHVLATEPVEVGEKVMEEHPGHASP
jgi:hypothetical protein